MPNAQLVEVVQLLRTLCAPEERREETDGELLSAFLTRRDQAAFTALLRRHGPMVLAVCQRVLRHEQDAEDVFQATFLLLARRASSIRRRESLGSWLHGVAYRMATKFRRGAARRSAHESQARTAQPASPAWEAAWREVQALLDEEIQRLPATFREAFVLCCVEGQGSAEVARRLGLREGTVWSRVARARERLQSRLARRGVSLALVLAAAAVSGSSASAAPRTGLVCLTARAALEVAAGQATECVSARVAELIEERMKGMFGSKLKGLAMVVFLGAALATAAGVMALRGAPPPTGGPEKPPPAAGKDAEDAAPAEGRKATDRYGDPLPPGAVARLGSLRFYHGSQVDRVVLSPDGKSVVSLSEGGHRLWDARSGKETVLAADLKRAFFFAAEDKLMAVKKVKDGIVLWDAVADKEVAELSLEIGPGGPLALSPDGKTLVWSSRDVGVAAAKARLTFADAAKGTVRHMTELKDGKSLWAFVFSADGKVLAALYQDNSVDVWDVKTQEVLLSVTLKNNNLRPPALSPDGGTLAAASYGENQIRFWDVRAKKELTPLGAVEPGRMPNGSVSYSPDGKYLAATYEAEVGLWDLAAHKEIRRLKGKESSLSCPIFSRDGKRLVAGDGNGISTWDVATGQPCHDLGHTYSVDALAFSPDGRTIASGAAYTDTILRTWDPLTGQIQGRWQGHKDGIEAIAYSPDGKLVASGSQDHTVRLWDATTGREVGCLEAQDGMIYAMAFSPDGKVLASGGKRKVVHFWDMATRQEVRAIDNPGGLTLRLAFSPDGKVLATRGFEEGLVRLWDVTSGTELRQLRDLKAGCPKISFAPDNRTLAVNCDDGTVRLFDVTTGREVRSLSEPLGPGQANRCLNVEFAPDGRSLAAAYDDGTTRLWEIVSGRERARFTGHSGVPLGLAFSPDGSLLVSGGSDHTALVWDVFGQRTVAHKRDNLTREERDRLWMDMADADASRAYRALQTLLANRDQAVAFLKERLRPIAAVDAEKIVRLIADLDNDAFAARENATKQLRELGDVAEPALREALNGKPSPEVRRRAEVLLTQLDAAHAPALVRGVEVLERIGTPEARQVLQGLAGGASEARLTREAKTALERLPK